MPAVSRDLVGRTHDVTLVVIEAGTVAVAAQRQLVVRLQLAADLVVLRGPGVLRANIRQLVAAIHGDGDLAGIELVIRIAGGLDLAHLAVQLVAEKRRHEFAAKALAVFAPQHAPVLVGQLSDLFDDVVVFLPVALFHQVEGGTHVQATDVDMPEHAVFEAVRIEYPAEFLHILRQVLGRHHGIFHAGNRLARAGHLAQQPDAALAQLPQRGDVVVAADEVVFEVLQ